VSAAGPEVPLGGGPLGPGLEGRHAFTDALHAAMTQLPSQGARELWMIDADFEGWPLDAPAVLESLSHWLRGGGRQVRMLSLDFDAVARWHPRFASWRRDRSHAFQAWHPSPGERVDMPSWWLAGDVGLELLDREQWRGRWLGGRQVLREKVDQAEALLHRCEPAWPSTTLGL